MFSKKRNDHSGAKTVTRSRKKAITRFSQWIWSVRLWPSRSKPLTMSASRIPIGVSLLKHPSEGPAALTNQEPSAFEVAIALACSALSARQANSAPPSRREPTFPPGSRARRSPRCRGSRNPPRRVRRAPTLGRKEKSRARCQERRGRTRRNPSRRTCAGGGAALQSRLASLRAPPGRGGGQLLVRQSRSHRGGLQLSNLNALRSDVRYLATSALPTVIGFKRLGFEGGPLRSAIIYHGAASGWSSPAHSMQRPAGGRVWS